MNTNQKIILGTMILVISGMFLYPPFNLIVKNGTVLNMGYAWIFEPPRRGYLVANVNTTMLLIQWIGVIVVGGLIFVLVKSSSKSSEASSIAVDFQHSRNEYQVREAESLTVDPQSVVEPKNQRQEKGPYPWKFVLLWMGVIFIAGFFGIQPPPGSNDKAMIAFKFIFALPIAILGGAILGVVKFFWRRKTYHENLNQGNDEKDYSTQTDLRVATAAAANHKKTATKCPLCKKSMLISEGRDYKGGKICDGCFLKIHSESSTQMAPCALCGRQTHEDDLIKYMAVRVCPECYTWKNAH